jgi:hypothetical protein
VIKCLVSTNAKGKLLTHLGPVWPKIALSAAWLNHKPYVIHAHLQQHTLQPVLMLVNNLQLFKAFEHKK